jgi:hypothetical protein
MLHAILHAILHTCDTTGDTTGTGDLQTQVIYRHRRSTGTGDITGDITITKPKAMGEYSALEAWAKIQAT